MTLHIITNPSALHDCLALVSKKDALLFRGIDCLQVSTLLIDVCLDLDGGIYWLEDGRPGRQEGLPAELKAIGYPKFVELCIDHPNSVTWT